MKGLDRDRWHLLWHQTSESSVVMAWFARLEALYSQSHRHYHTGRHIAECLGEFDEVRKEARQPLALELALWFHDAVYEPTHSDNEERSAELADECLGDLGVGKPVCESVRRLVLTTKRHDASLDPDAPLMVDIDLSILGQPPTSFQAYEEGIRMEYAWVPEDVFRVRRAEILRSFWRRDRIYHTEPFFSRYEVRARANILASLKTIEGSRCALG